MSEWLRKYYGFLKGAKIIEAGIKGSDEDESWPFFRIEKDGKQYEIEVSQDEEGNGPGFLFGLPRPR